MFGYKMGREFKEKWQTGESKDAKKSRVTDERESYLENQIQL